MDWNSLAKEIFKLSDEISQKPWFMKLINSCTEYSVSGLLNGGIEGLTSSHYSFFILGYAAGRSKEMEDALFLKPDTTTDLNSLFGGDVQVSGDNENGD